MPHDRMERGPGGTARTAATGAESLEPRNIEAYGWNQEQGNHQLTPMNTDNSLKNKALIGVHRSSSVVKDAFPSAALSDAEILERLVALNRERAEEEKRGLVRWLRPEYQAPDTVQATASALLSEEAEVESAASGPAPEPHPGPRSSRSSSPSSGPSSPL